MTAIGLLGGTFDPIHNAHLQLAEAVLATCGMQRVMFIPAAVPPHKVGRTNCSIAHRLHMVRLALADLPDCLVSELESAVDGPSYTIDTVTMLRSTGRAGITYYFIVGGDAFLEIETWHRWPELLALTGFIVAIRKGYPLRDLQVLLARHGFRKESAKIDTWRHVDHGNEVRLLTADIAAISSTEIRQRISQGRSWRHLVPDTVAAYIDRQHLYRGGDG